MPCTPWEATVRCDKGRPSRSLSLIRCCERAEQNAVMPFSFAASPSPTSPVELPRSCAEPMLASFVSCACDPAQLEQPSAALSVLPSALSLSGSDTCTASCRHLAARLSSSVVSIDPCKRREGRVQSRQLVLHAVTFLLQLLHNS